MKISNAEVNIKLLTNKIEIIHINLVYGDPTNNDFMSMVSKYIKEYIYSNYSINIKYEIIRFY